MKASINKILILTVLFAAFGSSAFAETRLGEKSDIECEKISNVSSVDASAVAKTRAAGASEAQSAKDSEKK